MITAIAAIGKNRVLGKNNELLWRIPDDLKRFKALTTGHSVIMGRKTFESVVASLGKALPNRTNIVVTRDPTFSARSNLAENSVLVAHSIQDAIEKAKEIDTEIFIIGGAQIYEQALPFTERLSLTLIDDEKDGDAFFPAYETEFTKIVSSEDKEFEGFKYKWVELERE